MGVGKRAHRAGCVLEMLVGVLGREVLLVFFVSSVLKHPMV